MNNPSAHLHPVLARIQRVILDHAGGTLLLLHTPSIDRVSELHGHAAANQLTESITTTLRDQVLRGRGEIEIMAHNKFLCLLPTATSSGIALLAAQRIFDTLATTHFKHCASTAFSDAYIGLALFPDHGVDAPALLHSVRLALQSAPQHNDRICLHEPEHSSLLANLPQYQAHMHSALEQNKLHLAYMPQIDVVSERIVGAEALLRWEDEVLGIVPPDIAVQIAESCGLMDKLTQWVVTRTVQQLAEFVRIDANFTLSMNMSPSNLLEPDLPLYIDRALRTWHISGKNLIVEITENTMISDPLSANAVLHEIKAHGVKLSIDDFGTGYSSLNYLSHMPLDELKIDQSFVRSMLTQANNAKIVAALITLAHNLGLTVIAEGVENAKTLAALKKLGCNHAQGYFIGEAMSAAALTTCLNRQTT